MHEVLMPERPPSRSNKKADRTLPRYDQALLAAKNAHRSVVFDLATPTGFTDDDSIVVGFVCQVDKYSIEIEIPAQKGRKVWISKAMIVGTEVQ